MAAVIPVRLIASRRLRYSSAACSAVLMTAAIFTLMYSLIGSGPVQRVEETLFTRVDIYEAPPESTPEPEVEPEPLPETQSTPTVEPALAPLSVNAPTPTPVLKVAGPPVMSFEPSLSDIALASGSGSAFGDGAMSGGDVETWTPPGDDGLAKKIAEAEAKGKAGFREVLPRATRQPNIPEYAWKNKIDGWVLVAFTVNALGNVENVRVLDANPKGVFEENVIASVKHWVYSPADFGGKKVKVQLTQKIELFWKDYPNNNKQLK
jgi:protein TonB